MSNIPIKILRIIPRDETYLDRKLGLKGEIFFNQDANALRLYDGSTVGGIELSRSDLSNVSNTDFLNKLTAVGGGGGGGNTTVSVGTTVPSSPSNGNLWLNTNTGGLYVYVNDGNSSQWIQPSLGTGGGGGGGLASFTVRTDDSVSNIIDEANELLILGTNGISTSSNGTGATTISFGGVTIFTDDSFSNIAGTETPIVIKGSNGITTASDGTGEITIIGSGITVQTSDATQNNVDFDTNLVLIGGTGITTTSDGAGNVTIALSGSGTDNVTFNDTTISTTDSSQVIFVPQVTFNSNIVVENDIEVNNDIRADRVTAREILSDGVGSPEFISETNFTVTAGNAINLVAEKINTFGFASSTEVVNLKQSSTGIVPHDFQSGSVWYHYSMLGNFTVNFTNVPITDNRIISAALILVQGGTARVPVAVQIEGVSQTINWLGAGGAPSGNNNQIDIVSFTLARTLDSWTVMASLSTYG